MKRICALILGITFVFTAYLTVYSEYSVQNEEFISDEYCSEDESGFVPEEESTEMCESTTKSGESLEDEPVCGLPGTEWEAFQHTSVTFFVSVNSLATVSYHAAAKHNTDIEATVYFEKLVLGRWERVDIGTNGNKLTNRASGYYISGSETVKVSGNGTYRAVVTFKNSKGSASGSASFVFNRNSSLADVNNDGKVSAMDARLALRFAAGLQRFNNNERTRSDVNCDGSLTAADARIILRIAADLM